MKRHDDPELRAFGRRVWLERIRRGWTRRQFAEAVGVHFSYVGQVERGDRNPTLLTVFRLAKTLGVPVARLVADD